uniref:Uncharacterized protein n=1 Tax=Avena sativa TaxID=4498 RepID=A0ACD5VP67_AVESA
MLLRCHIHRYYIHLRTVRRQTKPNQTPDRSFVPSPVDNTATSMSVGKNTPPSRRDAADKVEEEEVEGGQDGGAVVVQQKKESSGGKKKAARYSRCFSGLELSIGPGPLKDVDAGKLKGQITKWARAVVAYARQLSFGSPRSSPSMSSDGATPRSATFPSKSSGLGSDPPRAQLPP